MRHRKQFYVVAYDVCDDKRRAKIVKILENYGTRINLSVFELTITPAQFRTLKQRIHELCDIKRDHIIVYPLCIDCFAKIEAIAGLLSSSSGIVSVV